MESWGRGRAKGIQQRVRNLLGRVAQRGGVPLLLCVTLLSGTLGQLAAAGFGGQQVAYAAGGPLGTPGKPNRYDPRAHDTSIIHPWQAPPSHVHGSAAGQPLSGSRPGTYSMRPGTAPLSADRATHFVGSDGRLTVDVPAGAVTAADLTAAGGRISLLVEQVAGPAGASAGGSGLISFGMYFVQVVDADGALLTQGLRKPITLTLKAGDKPSAIELTHVRAIFNGPPPRGIEGAPLPTSPTRGHLSPGPGGATGGDTGGSPTLHLGPYSATTARFDPAHHTLAADVMLTTGQLTASFNTNSPVANFGGPDPFTVDLNAGGLTASYPINVPAGPGGLTPPVDLTYSSASVNEQHNPQSAAGWVGEGWNLSFGSISWSEHYVSSNLWENAWKLNDPFGTSADLIPPDLPVSSFWDDTQANYPCDTGTTGIKNTTTCPVTWHTTPETHARVVMYLNPDPTSSNWMADAAGARPPCWRVFLPNGLMEEFGCTQDSLQYYYTSNMGDYIANWLLDLISDPRGNQIHITYQRDMQYRSINGVHHTYVRDVVPLTVEYDSPTCLQSAQVSASNYCNGSAAPNLWQPLMRVYFNAAHSVSYGSACAQQPNNLRCDDPEDIGTQPNSMENPEILSSFVLNEIDVQAWANGGWHPLRSYRLSYTQTAGITIVDPVSGQNESIAGRLTLASVQEYGSDGTTTLPPVSYQYTLQVQYYVDSSSVSPPPNGAAGCGPSWNSPCNLWSQSHSGNSYYLSTVDNGLGMQETFTWERAHNNTHGGYCDGNGCHNADPLLCDSHETVSPCYLADDEAWSRIVLQQRQSQVLDPTDSAKQRKIISLTTYHYVATTFASGTQLCPECTASLYWGNQNDIDYLDYYNGRFVGFTETDVNAPDGSVQKYHYAPTDGWGVYDTAQVSCNVPSPRYGSMPCHNSPFWNTHNATHGRPTTVDSYDTNGTTLLRSVQTAYNVTCPPAGVDPTSTHTWSGYNWGSFDNMLVSELDLNNPLAACEVQTHQVDTYTYDGGAAAIHATVTYTYDGDGYQFGRVTKETINSNGGGTLSNSPTTIVKTFKYIQNNGLTLNPHSATGIYLITFLAYSDTEDTSGTVYACAFTTYDGQAYATGQQGTFALGEAVKSDVPTAASSCAGTPPASIPTGSGWLETQTVYDDYGHAVATLDADATNGDTAHRGCTTPTTGSTLYTTCVAYDTATETKLLSSADAKGYTTTVSYGSTPAATNGWGLWPVSTTDPNGAVTSVSYDALGRVTAQALPGDSLSSPTTSMTYTITCAATGPQDPCTEVDSTQRLDSSTTVTSRAFYDGYGRLEETLTPAPGAQTVVRYANYDVAGRDVYDSIAYDVAATTAWVTPNAPTGTSSTYDGLGRVTSTTDPLSKTTSIAYYAVTGWDGSTIADEEVNVIDPNSHRHYSLSDSLGRTIETVQTTGTGTQSDPWVFYAGTKYGYDYNGNVATIWHPNSTRTTTFTYDAAGRQKTLSDPDRGNESYGYDNNGNLTSATDGRPVTVYAGYDALNRPLWHSTSSNGSSPYATWGYDTATNGKGRLAQETFNPSDASLGNGSYSYSYDARGEPTAITEVLDGGSYPFGFAYNDAGQLTTLIYSDGDTLSFTYGAEGWLSQAQIGPSGGPYTTLVSNINYSPTDPGGAAGLPTSASLGGNVYTYSATHDADLRLTSATYTTNATHALQFQTQRGYDAAGNVTNVNTTLPGGQTDNQVFCYDEQDRLTWAGSTGTPPSSCGQSLTPGSLSAAYYTQSFSYDAYDRLTSGPLGAYTYGDTNHLHAATAVGSGPSPTYTASYDGAGNMVCRAPNPAVGSCALGQNTGQQLSYDAEGRLVGWQNVPGNTPDSKASFRYDGEGERVAQQTTSSGVTTTTRYLLGGIEELTTVGSTTTLTTYYSVPGVVTAVKVGTTLSYLATDGLGSVSVALAAAGSTTGQALYLPYGAGRYSSGSLPTARGYTGQYQDSSSSGLDYYGARYYDPVLGQFTSADSVLDGLNRYAYVHGNPETATDPSGHAPGDPWWSPFSMPQPTNVTDPLLQRLVDQIWGHQRPPGTMVGNGGTFDALRNEATTGVPTGGKWHYIKTNDVANGLFRWLRNNGTTAADPSDVNTANGLALDATDAAVAAINSPYSALIQGTPANLAATGTPPPSSGGSGGGSGGGSSGAAPGGGGQSSGGPSAGPTTQSGSNSGTGTGAQPNAGDGDPLTNEGQPPNLEGAQRWEDTLGAEWEDASSLTFTPTTPAGPPAQQTSTDPAFNPDDFNPADFGLPELPGDPFAGGDVNWGAMFDDFLAAFGDDGE